MAMNEDHTPPRRRAGRPGAEDVDRHVGRRLRERRKALGLTQQELAERVGITYQQAHKYETGLNRIAAGRLHVIAEALGVEVAYFFEGLGSGGGFAPTGRQRVMLELARNFVAAPDRRHQEALCALARALADEPESGADEQADEARAA